MSRLLTGSLLLCMLQSCFTHRAHETEAFLLLNGRHNKLLIVSVLPAENDTSGIAASSIFVNRFEDVTGQSNLFTHVFDKESGNRADGTWFIDSLMTFRNPGFPALLAPAERDSVPAFRFSLGRKKMVLETGPPIASRTEYVIRYPEQRPFATTNIGTAFGIRGIGSLPATLETVQGRELRQSSLLSVHCFDHCEPLFRRDRSWYWLDYVIGGRACHLFFEADASGKTRVHYSDTPTGESLTIELQPDAITAVAIRQNSAAPLLLRIISPAPERQPKNTFRVETVELVQNGIRAGSGILYKL